MSGNSRFAVCMIVIFLFSLGFWVWFRGTVQDDRKRIVSLEQSVGVLDRHVQTSEKILAALKDLAVEVRDARDEANMQFEALDHISGHDLYDALDRLLTEDRARRDGGGAAAGSAGGLPGAGAGRHIKDAGRE